MLILKKDQSYQSNNAYVEQIHSFQNDDIYKFSQFEKPNTRNLIQQSITTDIRPQHHIFQSQSQESKPAQFVGNHRNQNFDQFTSPNSHQRQFAQDEFVERNQNFNQFTSPNGHQRQFVQDEYVENQDEDLTRLQIQIDYKLRNLEELIRNMHEQKQQIVEEQEQIKKNIFFINEQNITKKEQFIDEEDQQHQYGYLQHSQQNRIKELETILQSLEKRLDIIKREEEDQKQLILLEIQQLEQQKIELENQRIKRKENPRNNFIQEGEFKYVQFVEEKNKQREIQNDERKLYRGEDDIYNQKFMSADSNYRRFQTDNKEAEIINQDKDDEEKKKQEEKNKKEEEEKIKKQEQKNKEEEQKQKDAELKRKLIKEEKDQLKKKKKIRQIKMNLDLIPNFNKPQNEEIDKDKQIPQSNVQLPSLKNINDNTDKNLDRFDPKSQFDITQEETLEQQALEKVNERLMRQQKIKEFIQSILIILASFLMDIIIFLTFVYPFAIVAALIGICQQLFVMAKGLCSDENSATKIYYYVIVILGSVVTVFQQVMFFYYINSDTIEKFWFLDAFIYMITSLLVFSYIKTFQQSISNVRDIFKLENFAGRQVINVLFMQNTGDDEAFVFDCLSDSNNQFQFIIDSYNDVMKTYQTKEIDQKYKKFRLQKGHPFIFNYKGVQIVQTIFDWLSPSYAQYIMLFSLILLKSFLALIYIFLHDQSFSIETPLMIIIVTVFYMNMTWSLSKILSSQDLRRKIKMMNKINSMIDFKSAKNEDFQQGDLIDIVCPISLESWDNTRQFVCDFCKEKLEKLEFAYVCLFFYYIFVIFICVVAYGEFYTIIPKESLYLQPLMVIQNSVDFLFLNVLLLFRIHFGQQFNDTFSEAEEKIDQLIGITEDLIQMYDYFFHTNQTALNQTTQEQQNQTVQWYITERIKYESNIYIDKNLHYLGQLYQTHDRNQLQKDILNNMLSGFEKIKKQIVIDSNMKCYKFLTVFKISFTESLVSLALAFASFLPVVITKFIQIFYDAKEEE